MNDELTKQGLTSYVMDEDTLINMIQDHLIAWAREEAQANNRNFSTCYEDTLVTFISTLEARA
jgi:hypothetical protein